MSNHAAFRRFVLPVLGILLAAGIVFSQDPEKEQKESEKKEKKAFTSLKVVVKEGQTAAPVPGADVRVKSEEEDTDYDEVDATNSDGIARFAEVPRGSVKIQVTAEGWKTFGERYMLTEKNQTIEVALTKENAR